MKGDWKLLTEEEKSVIEGKETEKPFSGKYNNFKEEGVYKCKRCGNELFRSKDKFEASCGWPSFDEEVPASVKKDPDLDGIRTEIQCANCGAHLGHVFRNENLTTKNIRYCVNSISMEFKPK